MLNINPRLSQKIANTSFVCACLIVCMHSPLSNSHQWFIEWFITRALAQIAVPVFFIISGLMLARHCTEAGWWIKELRKRVRTLVIPFFLLNWLYFPIYYGVYTIGSRFLGKGSSAKILQLTWYNFLSRIGLIPWEKASIIGQWYFKALILLVILSPIIYYIIKNGVFFAIGFIVFLLIMHCMQEMAIKTGRGLQHEIWLYELNMRCPLYFTLGMVLRLYAPEQVPDCFRPIAITFGIISIIFYRILSFDKPVIWTITTFFETLSISSAIWSIMPSKSWPKYLTGNSFPIFVLHGAILLLLPIPFRIMHIWNPMLDLLGSLPIAFFTIIFALFFAQILKHYTPSFAKILFGGR